MGRLWYNVCNCIILYIIQTFSAFLKRKGGPFMRYQIEYSCVSHIGRVRSMNQDNFICNGTFALPNDNSLSYPLNGTLDLTQPYLFGVFDGMGGEECGEMASYIAAKEASILPLTQDAVSLMNAHTRDANLAICQYVADNGLSSMGTTSAMLLFDKKEITLCNVGDSKIYYLGKNGLEQISTDHVAVAPYGRKPPLSQNLGIPPEWLQLEPFFAKGDYKIGDRYLICSDGLTDMVTPEEIGELMATVPVAELATLLTNRSLENGGRDNITIIVIEIQKK